LWYTTVINIFRIPQLMEVPPMQIKRISIFDEFHCTAADCPASCCRNVWKVPIDRDMYAKYRQAKGIWGVLLRCLTVKKKGTVMFRTTFRGCPFWGADHLCTMQKKHGTAYMPAVCIQFPRQLYHLGFFCEETLYLACPESAKLFLLSVEKDRPFDFTVTEGSVGYQTNTTNDDRKFLEYLLKSREELIILLKDNVRFDSMAILHYGSDAQNACLGGAPLPSPLMYPSDDRYGMNCERINILLFNGFYHPNLRFLSPLLYQLCRKYIRKFGALCRRNQESADRKLAALQKSLHSKIPDPDKLLNRYYEYFLLTNFLDIYEDYCFSKHLLFGIVKTGILWVFIALYAEDRKQISIDEIAEIIAVYERRAPQFQDALKLL